MKIYTVLGQTRTRVALSFETVKPTIFLFSIYKNDVNIKQERFFRLKFRCVFRSHFICTIDSHYIQKTTD